MAELKPCPNPECHGRARVLETLSSLRSSKTIRGFFVQCYICDMRGPTVVGEEGGDQNLAKIKACELWDALSQPREDEDEPVEPEWKCPYCGSRIVWECTNKKCGMIGPYARSERAAWRTLVRLNRRYQARSTGARCSPRP